MQPINQKLKNAFGITSTWPQITQTKPLKSASIMCTKSRKPNESVTNIPTKRWLSLGVSPTKGAGKKPKNSPTNHSPQTTHFHSIANSTIDVNRKSTRNQSTNTSSVWKLTIVVPNNKRQRKKSVRHTESTMTRRTFIGTRTTSPTVVPLATSILCDAEHDGRLIMHSIIDLKVDVLFNMLFSSTSTFLIDFHASRNSTDLRLGDWKTDKDGKQIRVVNVTMALQANVGPKTAKVTETHKMRSCSAPGELYSIDVDTINEGIPYADVFTIATHYCLSRTSSNSTDMVVFAKVNFIKSTWAVVKAFIVKHSFEGLEDFFQAIYKALEKEAENAKNK